MRPAYQYSGQVKTLQPFCEFQLLTDGAAIVIEDWWENVAGKSWEDGFTEGNAACVGYASRVYKGGSERHLSRDVLYGKVGGLGYLVHESEIAY